MAFTIVVPYDFSETAMRALEWAVQLTRSAGGTVRLLHIIPVPGTMFAPTPVVVPYPTAQEERAVREQLEHVAALVGIPPETDVLVEPDPGAAIVGLAREVGATLVVMGTHGRGGLRRAVLGSVSDYVTRHASCPVVTVREGTLLPKEGEHKPAAA
jgi:nucleotide-binding universal stress UspA family protein